MIGAAPQDLDLADLQFILGVHHPNGVAVAHMRPVDLDGIRNFLDQELSPQNKW